MARAGAQGCVPVSAGGCSRPCPGRGQVPHAGLGQSGGSACVTGQRQCQGLPLPAHCAGVWKHTEGTGQLSVAVLSAGEQDLESQKDAGDGD